MSDNAAMDLGSPRPAQAKTPGNDEANLSRILSLKTPDLPPPPTFHNDSFVAQGAFSVERPAAGGAHSAGAGVEPIASAAEEYSFRSNRTIFSHHSIQQQQEQEKQQRLDDEMRAEDERRTREIELQIEQEHQSLVEEQERIQNELELEKSRQRRAAEPVTHAYNTRYRKQNARKQSPTRITRANDDDELFEPIQRQKRTYQRRTTNRTSQPRVQIAEPPTPPPQTAPRERLMQTAINNEEARERYVGTTNNSPVVDRILPESVTRRNNERQPVADPVANRARTFAVTNPTPLRQSVRRADFSLSTASDENSPAMHSQFVDANNTFLDEQPRQEPVINNRYIDRRYADRGRSISPDDKFTTARKGPPPPRRMNNIRPVDFVLNRLHRRPEFPNVRLARAYNAGTTQPAQQSYPSVSQHIVNENNAPATPNPMPGAFDAPEHDYPTETTRRPVTSRDHEYVWANEQAAQPRNQPVDYETERDRLRKIGVQFKDDVVNNNKQDPDSIASKLESISRALVSNGFNSLPISINSLEGGNGPISKLNITWNQANQLKNLFEDILGSWSDSEQDSRELREALRVEKSMKEAAENTVQRLQTGFMKESIAVQGTLKDSIEHAKDLNRELAVARDEIEKLKRENSTVKSELNKCEERYEATVMQVLHKIGSGNERVTQESVQADLRNIVGDSKLGRIESYEKKISELQKTITDMKINGGKLTNSNNVDLNRTTGVSDVNNDNMYSKNTGELVEQILDINKKLITKDQQITELLDENHSMKSLVEDIQEEIDYKVASNKEVVKIPKRDLVKSKRREKLESRIKNLKRLTPAQLKFLLQELCIRFDIKDAKKIPSTLRTIEFVIRLLPQTQTFLETVIESGAAGINTTA